MIISLRVFDMTERIIKDIAITFSTLLCEKFLYGLFIPALVVGGYLLRLQGHAISVNWLKSDNYDYNVLRHLGVMLFTILFAMALLYPIEAELVIVESDGNGNLTERPVEPLGMSPFKKFGLEVDHYALPGYIGASIATVDFVLYNLNSGILGKVFRPLFSFYIYNPYESIFANYDRLMTAHNFDDMLEVMAEETKQGVIKSYKEINSIYASVGGRLFDLPGYNNETSHDFFITAGISPIEHFTLKDEEYGYFGTFPGKAKVNISYPVSLHDYGEKIRNEILTFREGTDQTSERIITYADQVIEPADKSLAVINTIYIDVYPKINGEIEGYKIKLFLELLETSRTAIKTISYTLKQTLNSDLENIVYVRNFLKGHEDKEKEEDNLLQTAATWTKNILISPVLIMKKTVDKAAAVSLGFIIYIIFLVAKIYYVFLFLVKGLGQGLAIATIGFSVFKALLLSNLWLLTVPIREYTKYRLWDVVFMMGTVFSHTLPYHLATLGKKYGVTTGWEDASMAIIMGLGLALQLYMTFYLMSKIKWTLDLKLVRDPHGLPDSQEDHSGTAMDQTMKIFGIGSSVATAAAFQLMRRSMGIVGGPVMRRARPFIQPGIDAAKDFIRPAQRGKKYKADTYIDPTLTGHVPSGSDGYAPSGEYSERKRKTTNYTPESYLSPKDSGYKKQLKKNAYLGTGAEDAPSSKGERRK